MQNLETQTSVLKVLEGRRDPTCQRVGGRQFTPLLMRARSYTLKVHAILLFYTWKLCYINMRRGWQSVFAVPYAEDCFLRDGLEYKFTNPQAPSAPQRIPECRNCGSEKKKVFGGTEEPLLTCTRCKSTRCYSKECQKANWKTHKVVCVAP